jgi:hypothetical protein
MGSPCRETEQHELSALLDEAKLLPSSGATTEEGGLQTSVLRTQNDIERLHEDIVRTQDGVALLGEENYSFQFPAVI